MDKSDYSDVNFPLDKEGRTLHVGVRKGEVANVSYSAPPQRWLATASLTSNPRHHTIFDPLSP